MTSERQWMIGANFYRFSIEQFHGKADPLLCHNFYSFCIQKPSLGIFWLTRTQTTFGLIAFILWALTSCSYWTIFHNFPFAGIWIFGGCKRFFEWFSHPAVWPDWAIYWTLGNFLKPLAKINLPKSPTFLGNFCKGVKIFHFSSKIILGNFYRHLAIFSGHTVQPS